MIELLLASSLAASVAIEVENFTYRNDIATVVMKITNTSSQTIGMVTIDCVFMDKNSKAIDIGPAVLQDMEPGQVSYEKAAIVTAQAPDTVLCQVERAR